MAREIPRKLVWRCLTLAWLWTLATVIGVAFRGVVDPPVSAFMQEKRLEFEMRGVRLPYIGYQWTGYADIAPAMRLAVVAAEDQNFPEHRGFDWDAIGAAFQHNTRSRRVRGGSTISQQTAKNLWLWPGRSYGRKLVEAWFTLLMETEWSKRRILETYLNVAQFDDNNFGVGAASFAAFGCKPAGLTPEQSALLAATLPSPDRFDVDLPSAYLQRRQAWILEQMAELGPDYLSDIER